MHKHRRTAAVAVAVSTALLAAACAPGTGSDEQGQPEPTHVDPADFAGEELTYVYFTDGPDEQATRDIIASFEEEYDVTVNLEVLPYADLVTSVQARLSGGNAPGVVRTADLSVFDGELLDVAPYLGDDYAEEFLPAYAAPLVGDDGEFFGVPSDLTLDGPFVNRELFGEAGVEVPPVDDPWTWEEMTDAAREVQEATGTPYAFAMDKSGGRVSGVLSQYGTQLVDAEGASLDTQAAVSALEPLIGMMAEDVMPRDMWLGSGSRYASANETFLAGDVPIYLSGNWQVAQFADAAPFEWSAAPNPCAQECGGFPGAKYNVAFRSSPNPALSAFFIEYLNTTENQAHFAALSGNLPSRVDLSEDGVEYPDRQADMDIFLADLARTPEARTEAIASPAFTGAANALIAQMDRVVAGDSELEPAVEELQVEIEDLVEEVGS